MTFVLYLQLGTLIAVTLLGTFALWRNQRSVMHQYFWLFATSTAGWNASLFIAISEIGQPLLWGRLAFLFGVLMATSLLLFANAFPEVRRIYTTFERRVLFVGIVFALASASGLIVKSAHIVDKTHIGGDFTPFVLLYLVYFFGLLIYAFLKLLRKYKRIHGVEKTHAKYVLLGTLLFFIPFAITNLILPNIFGMFEYNNLGPSFTLPMIILITHAIVRHRFLNLRVVIQRGLIFTLLLITLLASYLVGIFILGLAFQRTTNLTFFLSGAITTIVGVFSVPVVERHFRRWTNGIFFKGRYDFSDAVEDISSVLNSNIDLTELALQLQSTLRGIFRTATVNIALIEPGLILKSSGKFQSIKNKYSERAITELVDPWVIRHAEIPLYLDDSSRTEGYKTALREIQSRKRSVPIEITLPVTLTDKLVGIITLGHKLSGDPYTSEDLTLLKSSARHAAVAFEKARLYEKEKNYARDLEEKVKQRTAEIENLHEEQNQMMNEIAHSLQTPLTIAENQLGLLRRKAPSDSRLSLVSTSVDKISKFVYDILHLAKLESSSSAVQKEPLDLSYLLQEQVEYFEVLAEEKGIQVISTITPHIVIAGDSEMLGELIINLISNAEKYMSERGERKIFISLSEKNGSTVLEVRDTGRGISDEDIKAVFRKFYRAKDPSVKGTGLGLPICKKIVEKHKGTIRIESRLGKGTTFTVVLPKHTA